MNLHKEAMKIQRKKDELKEHVEAIVNEWYSLRHMLSFANWALFYILLGGREAG